MGSHLFDIYSMFIVGVGEINRSFTIFHKVSHILAQTSLLTATGLPFYPFTILES